MKNTTLCYIEKDGKYLMLHRVKKQNDLNHNKWIGVGGKLEEDESPEECLLREVREETGLELTHYRYCGIITFVSDQWEGEYMHLFHADGFCGELIACNEGNLEWVDKQKVLQLPTWEGDRLFLQRIAQPTPFFSMKLCYQGNKLVYEALDGKELPKTTA